MCVGMKTALDYCLAGLDANAPTLSAQLFHRNGWLPLFKDRPESQDFYNLYNLATLPPSPI